MSEPLKNKAITDIEYIEPFFWKSDVKSAVEWLKNELSKYFDDGTDEDFPEGIFKIINEAFEDVKR